MNAALCDFSICGALEKHLLTYLLILSTPMLLSVVFLSVSPNVFGGDLFLSIDIMLCTADLMYVIYVIDNVVANPFLVWKSAGSPQTPSSKLFQQMRQFEVISLYEFCSSIFAFKLNESK